MIISTPAIVLHLARVSDSASILHVYTRECGRVAYYIYGSAARAGKKASKAAALNFAPLSLLSIEAVHLDTREIQQLKDYSLSYVANGIASDIVRQTEALFMAEVLFRTLTHPLPDTELFDFLEDIIRQLDTSQQPENIHLHFLIGLIENLGFAIDFDDYDNRSLRPLLAIETLNNSQRREMLRELINYCSKHLPDFHEPKSLDIMTQIFA